MPPHTVFFCFSDLLSCVRYGGIIYFIKRKRSGFMKLNEEYLRAKPAECDTCME